jgi:hypothetical protein
VEKSRIGAENLAQAKPSGSETRQEDRRQENGRQKNGFEVNKYNPHFPV